MHQKSSWDQLGKLFALLPCSGKKGTELLAAMERLKSDEADLWFHWQFLSHLPGWI